MGWRPKKIIKNRKKSIPFKVCKKQLLVCMGWRSKKIIKNRKKPIPFKVCKNSCGCAWVEDQKRLLKIEKKIPFKVCKKQLPVCMGWRFRMIFCGRLMGLPSWRETGKCRLCVWRTETLDIGKGIRNRWARAVKMAANCFVVRPSYVHSNIRVPRIKYLYSQSLHGACRRM